MGQRIILLATAFLLFCSTLGLAAGPLAEKAMAAGCDSPSIAFGRWRWCGYWYNKFDDEGDSVRIGGVPAAVNSVEEYITLLKNDLASGDKNKVTGAKFVILTMIGSPLPSPPQAVGSAKTLTTAQFNEWAQRIRTYANVSTSGNTQYGSNGRVEWQASQHLSCGIYNTYWQGDKSGNDYDDVAPFIQNADNSDCENAASRDSVIIFRDKNGNEVYKIRRACMNPLGTLKALADEPTPAFNLQPGVTISPTTVAEAGDQVTITYTVRNSGSTASDNTSCTARGQTYTGYQANPASLTGGTPSGVATGCPRDFAAGATVTLDSETITLATGNQTVCRSLEVTPATFNGSVRRIVACVTVANKPFSKVFGGDVMVGSNPAGSADCSRNGASVLGWNRGSSATYAGAGSQTAVYAVDRIADFASAQNGTGAPTPTGLSFANTASNAGGGWFGGDYDAPCIEDYFTVPAGVKPMQPAVSQMTTGAYGNQAAPGGDVELGGGNVNPGDKIQVFIDGDLYISGNITYVGSWAYNRIPLFEVVVKGNIYISADVTQLDGIYIAQYNGTTSSGKLFNCTDPAAGKHFSEVPLGGNLASLCDNQLKVNGSLVAKEIQLLRTKGSLKQSAATDTRASSPNAAEIMSYGPAFWITQPTTTQGVSAYDYVTSLPPIL